MLDVEQKLILLVSILPYVCLAAYDGWLHEKARHVPPIEQSLHTALFISVLTLAIGLFLDHPALVLPAIAAFGLSALADELGFHSGLPPRERRLHFAAYGSFAAFVAVVVRTGGLA